MKEKQWICVSPAAGAMLAHAIDEEVARLAPGRLGRLLLPAHNILERAQKVGIYHNRAVALCASLNGTPYNAVGLEVARRVGDAMLDLHRLAMRRRRRARR